MHRLHDLERAPGQGNAVLSVSTLPLTAASLSTRMVSWNDAAEMNERVCSEALVIPALQRSDRVHAQR
jgi:hypothetical protein